MRSFIERVDKRRAILRAAGLPPVQIWLPDTRKSDLRVQLAGASRGCCGTMRRKQMLACLDAASDHEGWR
jgi:hypothetical protein